MFLKRYPNLLQARVVLSTSGNTSNAMRMSQILRPQNVETFAAAAQRLQIVVPQLEYVCCTVSIGHSKGYYENLSIARAAVPLCNSMMLTRSRAHLQTSPSSGRQLTNWQRKRRRRTSGIWIWPGQCCNLIFKQKLARLSSIPELDELCFRVHQQGFWHCASSTCVYTRDGPSRLKYLCICQIWQGTNCKWSSCQSSCYSELVCLDKWMTATW